MNWIGGIHAVATILEHQPERVIQLMLQEGRVDQKVQAIIKAAKAQGIRVQTLSEVKLNERLPGIHHQGVAAECKALDFLHEHDLLEQLDVQTSPLLLILDGVQDPHNLGACLRSADAAGVKAVIIPKDRAVSVNATVRKVACGAAEFVPVVMVTNLARTMKSLAEKGVFFVGLAGEATKPLYQTDLTGAIALVLGAEENGLRRLTREHCDHLAFLPMAGVVSSLNVSVAAGVALFEAVRQRNFTV